MKKVLLASLFIALITQVASAQCRIGPPRELSMGIELTTNYSLKTHGMQYNMVQTDLTFGTGGRLNVLGSIELADYHLYDTHLSSTGIGGGLSYTLFKNNENRLLLAAKAGSTIGNADWKYTYYDASLRLQPRFGKSASHGIIAIGYRYADSHTAGIRNRGFVYASLGVRF